jgi:hypothetical protein
VLAVVLLLVGLTAVGCAHKPESPTLTHEQATVLADQYLREAVAHLNPTPRLEPGGSGNAPCSGPNDDQDTGMAMYEQHYWMRDLDPAHNRDVFNQLEDYWKANNYVVVLDTDPTSTKQARWRVARNTVTGFKMRLVQSNDGGMSMLVQSPCVPRPTLTQTSA